jgi:ATP-binding cassette subfamily C (CFTR/MRP) protein 10
LILNFLILIGVYTKNTQLNLNNDSDEQFESLIDRSASITTSRDSEEDFEESEEDKASYYSYLTFKWLRNLMQKGYRKNLTQISDLCRLPYDLNIDRIFDTFLSKYFRQTSSEYTANPILDSNLLRDSSFVDRFTSSYDDDSSVVIIDSQNQTSSKNALLKALLKSFGTDYFLLGVLKFIGDVLNFSGPILLNQLVQFVEYKNNSKNLRDGLLYAGCLFFFTLLSCLLNIHFSNSLNKLCLRIRVALISFIYRKSLLVKLNELNQFSIGQIVNYMSIDNDSIVNAFPSFHAFWSLPLQISITLYLLYSQIGMSFLVGESKYLIKYFILKRKKRLIFLYFSKRCRFCADFNSY